MITWAFDLYQSVEAFLYVGGDVLTVLFAVSLGLWICIVERLWFFLGTARTLRRTHEQQELRDWSLHEALWQRNMWLSEVELRASQRLALIKTLVAVCPLLGLLGTITGMIEVFQTMAITGSNSARALSSGIAHATLPTLAGLTIALSGYYFVTFFDHRFRKHMDAMREQLLLPTS